MATKKSDDLEAALPSLIKKLKIMQESLSPDEKKVFEDIVRSAAKHTEVIQAASAGALEKIRYMKPMSVHGTEQIRRQFIALPSKLGMKE